ncbi:MAG: M50 family metallopeptidase [Anaerolineales bacterium]
MLITVLFIIALGFLILIHELGHFLAAKAVGIPIQEFGIGFPPKMLTLFKKWGTEFTLNWLPIGGFVRAKERQDDNEVPDEMLAAKPWRRIIFLLAGSTVNILFAILIMATNDYAVRKRIDHVLIESIDPGSPAEMAGLENGDQVAAINGDEISTAMALVNAINENMGNELELTIYRDGETFTTSLTPRTPDQFDPLEEGSIGVRGIYDPTDVTYIQSLANTTIGFYYLTVGIFDQAMELVGLVPMRNILEDSISSDISGPSEVAGSNTVWYLASISFSLGILNLFPVPIFDGGKILFALWEMLTRKRVPINVYYILNMASLGAVLLLMVYVNVRDIINPVIGAVTQTPIP